MIKNITLKSGTTPESEPLSIDLTPVTVFVGPNNSGKSKILSEIIEFCQSGIKKTNTVVLDTIEFENLENDTAIKLLENITLKPKRNENVRENHILIGKDNLRYQVKSTQMLQTLETPNSNTNHFCQFYLRAYTTFLGGSNRINLVRQQQAGNMQEPPHSSFQTLFRDDKKSKEVRRSIHDAFGVYFTLDPTNLGHLQIKLSSVEPKNDLEERGIHKEAVDFHSSSEPVETASDGVKAFTGMITEIIAGDPKVLIIDEPEAFLHPSLSHKLGKEIATAAENTNKRIFVSTHSSNFIMGCIQSGVPINIVRLTYKNKVATARVLPNDDILKLMRDPLLRSTGVLEGLFYENVMVTEGDTDRAFYQEINERLLQFKPRWGISNCLFLNAQNKQTIRRIIKPLRELGIPAAGITDIDVLKEGGQVWANHMKSGFIPTASHTSLAEQRRTIKQKFDESGKDMKRDGGVAILNADDKESANNLFDSLDQYGLFVVRNGEVETWLKSLKIGGHGAEWLIPIFEKMGSNPNGQKYLKPKTTDVWKFVKTMKEWFDNPNRKGIPS